jgi:hypothetical protein
MCVLIHVYTISAEYLYISLFVHYKLPLFHRIDTNIHENTYSIQADLEIVSSYHLVSAGDRIHCQIIDFVYRLGKFVYFADYTHTLLSHAQSLCTKPSIVKGYSSL